MTIIVVSVVIVSVIALCVALVLCVRAAGRSRWVAPVVPLRPVSPPEDGRHYIGSEVIVQNEEEH